MSELRFGILMNDFEMQRWQEKSISMLLSDSRLKPVLLIIPEKPTSSLPQKKGFQRFDRRTLYKIYRRFFHRVEMMDAVRPNWIDDIPVIRCKVEQKGFSQYFTPEDIDRIKSHQPDFLLRFGFNIIRGSILNAAHYGVWSFHHGDEQYYRGGPPAFWETLHGKTSCGAILHRLTETLDGGIILKKGHFHITLHSLAETHNELLKHTAHWPLQVARDILSGIIQPAKLKPTRTQAPIYRFPENRTMLKFIGKLIRNKGVFHYRQLFLPEQWNVGIINQPIEKILDNDLAVVNWLPKQKSRYFRADPFGFTHGNRLYLLYELYDQQKRRGKIGTVDADLNAVNVFPELPFHCSYPFVFEYQGGIYAIPETIEDRKLMLFQFNEDQQQFEVKRVLMENIEMADATLAEIDGRWWLFCTQRPLSNTALYLYHADSPFGPFEPHQNNPVKWDVNNARPAGNLFQVDHKWYRPAQDCNRCYGAAVVINEIERISPTEFSERTIKKIDPVAPYHHGLHTLSRWGNQTLIDGKVYRFSVHQFIHQLRKKIGG